MGAAHDHLQQVLFGPQGTGTGHPWPGVIAALHIVCSERSPESEALLRRLLLEYTGQLRLDPVAGLPHAMPPEDLLRSVAVQTLAEWDLDRHRDAILPHAHPDRRDILGNIARTLLAR